MAAAAAATAAPVRASAPASPEIESEAAVSSGMFVPWVTTGIMLAIIAVFWAELHYAVTPTKDMAPSLRTIVALGGVSRDLAFGKDEWWRIFTAPLMHGGLDHIVGNGIALFFAALNLERMVGARWLGALFFLGALGGVAGSLIGNPHDMVTVGASGAIMCLLAALIVLSLDSNVVKKPARIQRIAFFLLIPSLAPAAAGTMIDISAHIGGCAMGIVLGFLIQITWKEESDKPGLEGAAGFTSAAGALLSMIGFALVAQHFEASKVHAAANVPDLQLMSEADLPADAKEADKKSSDLVRKFPDDPRAHFFRAVYYLRGQDLTSAQSELRTALSEKRVLDALPASFTATIKIVLAATLVEQGRIDDATTTAKDACDLARDQSDLYDILHRLQAVNVCPTDN
ncbi:MAG TPA: rhomboid family intramembrane serine protease [Rhizomicrobium sp.]|jgi:rhomboid protease GluP|nr:rhomboid family intramembrane serine protease [Rhizomicrobium sp.]